MSDYLVNLARRSAGLAPVARARPVPPPPPVVIGAGVTTRDGDTTVRRPGAGAAATDHAPERSDVRVIQRIEPTPALPLAVAPSARSSLDPGRTPPPAPRPGRAVTDDPAARWMTPAPPAPERPATPTRIAAPASPDARAGLRIVERGLAPLPVVDAGAANRAASIGPMAPTGVEPMPRRVPGTPVPATAPFTPRPAAASDDTPRIEARVARLETAGSLLPAEGARRRLEEPAAVEIRPATPAFAVGRPPTVERPPDREVHIRIGTIEIQGADPTPPAAPAPAARPAAAAGPSPGGFDDFFRLRTYAPWER